MSEYRIETIASPKDSEPFRVVVRNPKDERIAEVSALSEAHADFVALAIDADARAQTLSVSDFVGLANRVVERAEKP